MSPGAQGGLRFQSEQFLRGTRDRGGPARPRTEGVRRWCRGTRGQTMELQSRKPGRALAWGLGVRGPGHSSVLLSHQDLCCLPRDAR